MCPTSVILLQKTYDFHAVAFNQRTLHAKSARRQPLLCGVLLAGIGVHAVATHASRSRLGFSRGLMRYTLQKK